MQDKQYIGLEISRISNLLRRNFGRSEMRREMEETTGKYGWIIGYLVEHQDEDIYQKDIESVFSLRRSTVSNTLKLMEKKGYIERISVDSDARLKKLVPTQKALDMHRRMVEQLQEREQLLQKDISEEELNSFIEVLRKIRHNIGEKP